MTNDLNDHNSLKKIIPVSGWDGDFLRLPLDEFYTAILGAACLGSVVGNGLM